MAEILTLIAALIAFDAVFVLWLLHRFTKEDRMQHLGDADDLAAGRARRAAVRQSMESHPSQVDVRLCKELGSEL